MQHGSNSNTGRYTSFFTAIPAGEVIVPGAPNGSAGSVGVSSRTLSSLAGIFSLGQDTLRLMSPSHEPFVRRLMPARPATQANVPGHLAFADAD
jgi:hypothetical protein